MTDLLDSITNPCLRPLFLTPPLVLSALPLILPIAVGVQLWCCNLPPGRGAGG